MGKSIIQLQVDWSELDVFGHVNNLTFFKYAQAGRLGLFEKVGLTKDYLPNNPGPILKHTQCDFKQQLHFPNKVSVTTTVKSLGNTSLELQHTMVDNSGTVVAEVSDVIVVFDFEKQQKELLSAPLREKLSNWLQE